MFLTIVNPMEDDSCMEETPCDLTKPRIVHENTVYRCNLKLTQERGLQFYQTRSRVIVLYNTLPAVCIEKLVCMKTKDEVYQKVRLTPRVPRVLLKPNSQIGLQDQEHLMTNPADQRAPGRPGTTPWVTEFLAYLFSAVEQQDTNRKDKVNKVD